MSFYNIKVKVTIFKVKGSIRYKDSKYFQGGKHFAHFPG